MKSLNEEIAAIKGAKMTKTAKKQALIKLGLTPYECDIVLVGVTSTSKRNPQYTFGVEIECCVGRSNVERAARETGMAYNYMGYNHITQSVFKFVSDASLTGYDSIECVSPILKGRKGFADLKNAVRTLNLAGASVNRSCGLHVHVGAKNMTDKQYANIFVNYAMIERVVDAFMAPSRRNSVNSYCKSVDDRFDRLVRCNSKSDVASALYYDRYYKVNPMSYERHKTVEFRQHQGTTNAEKIEMWVNFCVKLVAWSAENRFDSHVYDINEIPFLNKKEKQYYAKRIAEFE